MKVKLRTGADDIVQVDIARSLKRFCEAAKELDFKNLGKVLCIPSGNSMFKLTS